MTQFTEKKAQNLIDTKCIIQIDDDTYHVKSSTPGKSYIISDEICECLGFKFRGECSHVIAVQMLQKLEENSENQNEILESHTKIMNKMDDSLRYIASSQNQNHSEMIDVLKKIENKL